MTDITPTFNVCLGQRGSQPVERKPYNLQQINSFLQEAHSINARIVDLHRELRAIRPAYLSTVPAQRRRHAANPKTGEHDTPDRARPLTDAERDAFDAQSKLLLRQLNGAITHLQQAEEVRNQTADSVALARRARGGLGALGRWAAGGAVTAKSVEEELAEAARATVSAHREAVVLFLRRRLELAGRLQSEMMDVRLSREVEKSKSILAKSAAAAAATTTMGGIPYVRDREDGGGLDGKGLQAPGLGKRGKTPATGGLAVAAAAARLGEEDMGALEPAESSWRQELTSEQMQAFAEENHELLKHYEDQLDQVRTAEKSILEISELHTTLHANLQQQSENIDQLVQDSYLTTENLGKGNKELKKASERRSTAQAVFYSTVAFCSFLVVWDLVF